MYSATPCVLMCHLVAFNHEGSPLLQTNKKTIKKISANNKEEKSLKEEKVKTVDPSHKVLLEVASRLFPFRL